ncbi:heme exporter protein CcmD [Maritimibacter alexandrii]|jgi:heme exporter protein D|uniref:heme exporter protein CcmD n=1 Tax=Maritimibacter alexandrii TaxID=2570355 RepID=UPI001107E035|nr:heme exporter protein CcmD [Maritimibacter alexandrii]
MPDLGKYAGAILTSWGATILLVALVIAVSWWQSARVKKKLEAAEARRKGA